MGGCQRPLCHPCQETGGKGISCRKESVNYKFTCKPCKKEEKKIFYLGETGRSAYERAKEHVWNFRMKKEGDPEKNEANGVLASLKRRTPRSTKNH